MCGQLLMWNSEIESSRGYTKAVDLWGSGVMVAFMLTGDLLKVDPNSSMSDQQEDVDEFCNKMIRQSHVKPNSVDFIRKLLVLDPNSRWSAPFALNHKWFTESIREAAEQAEVYKRATMYWKKREPEVSVVEDISPAIATVSTREDSVMRRRKKLPDATSSPYFTLDRHLQAPKVPPTRKQLLRDLKVGGSSFVVDPEPQMSTKWNSQTQKSRAFEAVKFVDGRNMFSNSRTPRISESQIETQDLTPGGSDEVDLVSATPSSAEKRSKKGTKGLLKKRSLTTSTSRTPLSDNAPSKKSRAQTGSESSRNKEAELNELPECTTTKALKALKETKEMKENIAGRNKGSKRGLYR